jgi:hypothetical protein
VASRSSPRKKGSDKRRSSAETGVKLPGRGLVGGISACQENPTVGGRADGESQHDNSWGRPGDKGQACGTWCDSGEVACDVKEATDIDRDIQTLPYHTIPLLVCTAKSRKRLASILGTGIGIGSGSGVRQAAGALVFRPLPWSACVPEGLSSRFSRRFDVGMVNMSCFARVSTMYKRKGQKVLPQNVARTDGATPGGEVFWKDSILKQEQEMLKGRSQGNGISG